MRILVVLTYYSPNISGLTIYTERLAKAWAKRGHQVTVLTSHFDRSTPADEVKDGVRIVRAPVLFRISKGVIMPTLGEIATRLVLESDVIQLHLPQFDAAGVALRGRLLNKPTVITYHCDLRMPPGLMAWAANQAIRVMNNLAAISCHRIVTYTSDYAENSPYAKRYMHKVHVIPPPVELPKVTPDEVAGFGQVHNPQKRRPVIGMVSRFATEKGVEVMLNSLPRILEAFPDAQVQFAGPYRNIIGEEKYFQRLSPIIQDYEQSGHWQYLGPLSARQLSTFYPNIDLLALPSLNSTEAFGLVQIEAMLNGVPCVASNLPGVRQPVLQHEMGKIIPIGDAASLAEAAISILKNPMTFRRNPGPIAERYLPGTIAIEYENLFEKIMQELHHSN
jgi:glycosyltransferase involved in cell wall biosynthesis